MLKKWLAVLAALILVLFTIQMLWATGGQGTGDDHPWNGVTGSGSGGTISPASRTGANLPIIRIYLVQPSPLGGFYLIRVNFPSGITERATAGVKRAGD